MAYRVLAIIFIAAYVFASDEDSGATEIQSSLSKAMEDEAIFVTIAKLAQVSESVGIAQQIATHFDETYGGSWNCVVKSASDARDISFRNVGYVAFRYKTFFVLLWQSR
ncbi:hypothetical protein HDE_11708 [Halotydeus destructor]|nr:hypothetical protein HDE_11708 [Halotydeus destructor]